MPGSGASQSICLCKDGNLCVGLPSEEAGPWLLWLLEGEASQGGLGLFLDLRLLGIRSCASGPAMFEDPLPTMHEMLTDASKPQKAGYMPKLPGALWKPHDALWTRLHITTCVPICPAKADQPWLHQSKGGSNAAPTHMQPSAELAMLQLVATPA